jgi:hypothetical protein
MKKIELFGKVKVDRYPFRLHDFNRLIVFYNKSGENIAIAWDDSQQCCEDFEADVPPTLLNTEFPNGVCVEVSEQEDTVTFTVTEREVETPQIFAVTIRNEHNGYYAHAVGLLRNGKYHWQSLV